MADRTVRVVLNAVTSGYEAGMARAATSTKALETSVSSATSKVSTMGNAQVEASRAMTSWEQTHARAAASVAQYGQSLDRSTEAGRRNRESLDSLAAASTQVRDKQLAAGQSVEQVNQAMGRSRDGFVSAAQSMGMSGDAARKLADQYGLVSSQSQTLADKTRAHSDAIGRMSNVALVAGGVVAAGIGVVVAAAANFDQAMSNVAATGQDARNSLGALGEAAIKAGADTKFSATEAAQAEEELAKAGVSAADILGGGLTGALNLAAAGNMGVAEAAEISGTALSQFNLSGDQASHVSDLLAAGAGKAQGEVHDMGYALSQSGMVANQFGLSIEETVGGLTAFANAGMIGSDAGTSLKSMLLAIAHPSKEAGNLMSSLGLHTYDASGSFIGLAGLAGQLQTKLGGLTDQQREEALATIFGSDAMRAASILYKEGAQGMAEWTMKVNEAGYAQEAAAAKMGNLKGDIEQLRGSIETLFIKMGEASQGPLRGLTQGITSLVNGMAALPQPVQQVGVELAGLGAAGAIGVGAFGHLLSAGLELKANITELATEFPRAAAGLEGLGKAAAVAGAAFLLVSASNAAYNNDIKAGIASTDNMAAAMMKAGDTAASTTVAFHYNQGLIMGDLNGLDQGIARAFNPNPPQVFLDKVMGLTGGITPTAALTEQFGNLDKAMTQLATGGQSEVAAGNFKAVADAAAAQKMPVEQLIALFPAYHAQLQQTAQQLGIVDLSAQQYADWMGGKVPDAVQKAADANPRLASSLAGVKVNVDAAKTGVEGYKEAQAQGAAAADSFVQAQEKVGTSIYKTADGATILVDKNGKIAESSDQTAVSLGKQAKAQEEVDKQQKNSASSAVSLSGAQIAMAESIDKAAEAAKKGGAAVTEGGEAFNLTKKSGREAQKTLDDLASSAINLRTQQENTHQSTEDINKSMADSRQKFIDAATGMGINSEAAKQMADAYGLVPRLVVTKVEAQGAPQAATDVNNVKDAAKGVPQTATVNVSAPGAQQAANDAIHAAEAANAIPPEKVTQILAPGAQQAANDAIGVAEKVNAIPPEKVTQILAPGAQQAANDAIHAAEAANAIPPEKSTVVSAPGAPQAAADMIHDAEKANAIPGEKATNVAAPGATQATDDMIHTAEAANNLPPDKQVNTTAPGAVQATGEIDNLHGAANGLPPSKQINTTAPGAVQSKGEIGNVHTAANGLPPSKSVNISTPGAANSISLIYNLRDSIASLRDRTVNVVTNMIGGIGKATGGYVSGPGSDTSDSIPARLSNGEFVIRAAAVRSLGIDRLEYMNALGQMPAFASGGVVAREPVHAAVPRFAGGGLVAIESGPAPDQITAAQLVAALASVQWVMDGHAIDVRLEQRKASDRRAQRAQFM